MTTLDPGSYFTRPACKVEFGDRLPGGFYYREGGHDHG